MRPRARRAWRRPLKSGAGATLDPPYFFERGGLAWGTHHCVSQQHFPAYLNEFMFRFNRRFYPMSGVTSALGIGVNVTGPTCLGLYDGQVDSPEGAWEPQNHK